MGAARDLLAPQSTNPLSSRVCERIGMRFDRAIKCPATVRRGAVTAHLYVMTREMWDAGPQRSSDRVTG